MSFHDNTIFDSLGVALQELVTAPVANCICAFAWNASSKTFKLVIDEVALD